MLELAALDGVEALLAARLNALLVDGKLPDIKEFAPRHADCPVVNVEMTKHPKKLLVDFSGLLMSDGYSVWRAGCS